MGAASIVEMGTEVSLAVKAKGTGDPLGGGHGGISRRVPSRQSRDHEAGHDYDDARNRSGAN